MMLEAAVDLGGDLTTFRFRAPGVSLKIVLPP